MAVLYHIRRHAKLERYCISPIFSPVLYTVLKVGFQDFPQITCRESVSKNSYLHGVHAYLEVVLP